MRRRHGFGGRWSTWLLLAVAACGDPGGDAEATDTTGAPTSGTSAAATTTAAPTSDGTTTNDGATDGTGADSTGDATTGTPVCRDDDDCPANTTCDVATGACKCDPTVAACVDDVPSGHWVELQGTAMADVFPPAKTVPGNPNSIIDAWSGGVYDRDRNRMVVWGGGHADYSGNEVYAFDLEALAWTRLTDPSLDVGGDEPSGYYPDGLPRSRHTYDYLVYVPELGSMCSAGGAGMWMSGQVNTANFDCFDFETLTWSSFAPTPGGEIAGIADYDAGAGRVAFVTGPQLRYLAQYDVATDVWTPHGDNFINGGLGIRLTGRVHPTARRFVAVGGGSAYAWDLDAAGAIPETSLVLAAAPPDFALGNPGLDYAASIDRLVWWGGGTSLWSLDLDGMTWVEHPAAPDNTVSPPPPVANGTYGRFRYAITNDVFVLVSAATDNVFARRL
jgi:hypothetical protein